jgi:hypothetical protein
VSSNRNRILIVAGCLVLAALCCLVVLIAGGFYYFQTRTAAENPGVAYVLDTSTRMGLQSQGGSRLEVAQGIMSEIVRPGNPQLTSGLRVFGSGVIDQSCEDTELVVPFETANQQRIASELGVLELGASEESAMAQAMVDAIRDLAATDGPQSLVVVTGGSDSCHPQASELIAREAELAGIRLQTFVVGFEVSEDEAEAIKGLVSDIPGATYHDAPDAEALLRVLTDIQVVIDQPGGPVASTACDHPYLPVLPGASWTFSGDGYTYNMRVESVSGDMQSARADVVSSFPEGSVTLEWTCAAGGVSFTQMGAFSVSDTVGVGKFEIIDQSGNTLLPTNEFVPGASWSSEHTMAYSIGIAELDSAFTSHTSENHSAGAPQTITTPAGTFEAIPVTSDGTVTTSGQFGIGSNSYTSVVYYSEGVGIVRIETFSEGFGIQLDLQSYFVP